MNEIVIPNEIAGDPKAMEAVMAADELSDAMQYVEVTSKSELDFAAAELVNIVTRKDEIEATFKRLKEPFQIGINRLREWFDIPIARLVAAEGVLKAKIGQFQRSELARVDEAKRNADTTREEEIAIVRDQLAELEVASITANSVEEANEHARAAEELRGRLNELQSLPPPADIEPAAKAAGVSSRTNWQGEVTDVELLWAAAQDDGTLRALFVVDQAALNRLAKVIKGSREIPGLRIFDKGSVAVRRNRRSPESPQP